MSFLLNSPYITCILGAFLIITVILLIFSVYLILYVIREYKKLEQMIDSAIDGNFQEESFDEQRLSRLQNKMYQFISSSLSWQKEGGGRQGKNRRAESATFPIRQKRRLQPSSCIPACWRNVTWRKKKSIWLTRSWIKMTGWPF